MPAVEARSKLQCGGWRTEANTHVVTPDKDL